jgi:hypothetical protein
MYGRAAPGERVIETVPQNYGENVSMLATIGLDGIEAPMTISGAVDVTCSRKITPKRWRESTRIKTGDFCNEENIYR